MRRIRAPSRGPSIVIDGRVIGIWRRTLARTTVAIEIDAFETLIPLQQRAIDIAARRATALSWASRPAFLVATEPLEMPREAVRAGNRFEDTPPS